MDASSIELPGSSISAVTVAGDTVRIRFEPAHIIKSMTGSVERTKWWQNGELVFTGAELDEDSALPALPVECAGGDVGENVYTYRDMIPLPLESRGHASCAIRVKGSDAVIRVQAKAVKLVMEDVAKYIEHIRPE
jgi:hypothetical protein